MNWRTEVFGKCILAGEHAVLRGVPALVVPLTTRSLILEYTPMDCALRIEAKDSSSDATRVVLTGVLEQALRQKGKSLSQIDGVLRVQNSIPFGAGLGASAALCVAVGRFCVRLGLLNEEQIFEFSRELENLFHGESSGVDVAVAQMGQPIKYRRGQGFVALRPAWRPQLYLSYSGHKGVTSECVDHVKALREKNPVLGEELDQKMRMSVDRFEQALTGTLLTDGDREKDLISALDVASECFVRWGLTEGSLENHMKKLRDMGALGLKPTGSGGGGHVISYWQSSPPLDQGISFIPLVL